MCVCAMGISKYKHWVKTLLVVESLATKIMNKHWDVKHSSTSTLSRELVAGMTIAYRHMWRVLNCAL